MVDSVGSSPHSLRGIHRAGLCYLDRDDASQILALAFRDDCFYRYVLHTWGKVNNAAVNDLAMNLEFFNELLKKLQSKGAFCVSVSGSLSVVVW